MVIGTLILTTANCSDKVNADFRQDRSCKFRDEREIYLCTRKRQGCTRKRQTSGRGSPPSHSFSLCSCTHFVQRIYITLHRTSSEEGGGELIERRRGGYFLNERRPLLTLLLSNARIHTFYRATAFKIGHVLKSRNLVILVWVYSGL